MGNHGYVWKLGNWHKLTPSLWQCWWDECWFFKNECAEVSNDFQTNLKISVCQNKKPSADRHKSYLLWVHGVPSYKDLVEGKKVQETMRFNKFNYGFLHISTINTLNDIGKPQIFPLSGTIQLPEIDRRTKLGFCLGFTAKNNFSVVFPRFSMCFSLNIWESKNMQKPS